MRVKTYTDLAAAAPTEVRADASTVRDGVIKVNNALNAAGYQSGGGQHRPDGAGGAGRPGPAGRASTARGLRRRPLHGVTGRRHLMCGPRRRGRDRVSTRSREPSAHGPHRDAAAACIRSATVSGSAAPAVFMTRRSMPAAANASSAAASSGAGA